jgi:hypothetical protein
VTTHPDWCAQGHRCALGEHRSEPLRFPAPYGALVATLVRAGDRTHLEVHATVRLPPGEVRGRDVARLLLVGVDLTVRAVLAGRLGRVRAAYRRVTGVRVR